MSYITDSDENNLLQAVEIICKYFGGVKVPLPQDRDSYKVYEQTSLCDLANFIIWAATDPTAEVNVHKFQVYCWHFMDKLPDELQEFLR